VLRLTSEHAVDEGTDTRPHLRGKRLQAHLAVKRLMDVVLSMAALVVLAPLLAVVAILIKRDSPGPVLFSHRREQRGGKEFQCFKFRTMSAGAHRQQRALYKNNEVDGPQFKLRDDPRVTRVGRWIRATNVDELPQLINVLLGHMSLVGPRPSPFRENQICVPWRRARLSVRPGITGLWQLCRDSRREGDFHQWIFYDMAYVRHFSIWLDLKILLATVLSLAGRYPVPLSWLVHGADSAAGSPRRMVASQPPAHRHVA
jgi:lipopolysaccharide/colanic/teichoic acid biosynthesis glycosyltransferase